MLNCEIREENFEFSKGGKKVLSKMFDFGFSIYTYNIILFCIFFVLKYGAK